jgi:hypothetical protein
MSDALNIRLRVIWKMLTNERAKRIFGFAFVIAPLITILMSLIIFLKYPWEFDESYNLQIVQNLRSGNGYATNGAFRGLGPYLFDPYISTGPSVLLPIWVVSIITRNTLLAARLVMLCYFLFTLALLYKLSPRSNLGRFSYGLMLMAIIPTVIATNPLGVLGEPPAMTFFLLATVAMKRGKISLTGVALAAVVLCKLNFVLAALAFLFFAMIKLALNQQNDVRVLVRKAVRLISSFIAPLLAFEIYRLFSLGGLTAYRTNIRELRNFVDSQGLDHWSANAELLGKKLTSLINIPGPLVWAAIGICILSFSFSIAFDSNSRRDPMPNNASIFAPALMSGLFVLGTFLFLSLNSWQRQAASSFFLFFPLLISLALDRLGSLASEPSRRIRLLGVLMILLITIPLGLQTLKIFENSLQVIRSPNFGAALEAQRDGARIIRDSGATSINLDGWFQNPEYQLLSGIPAVSMPDSDAKTLLVVSMVKYSFGGTYDDFLSQKDLCSEVLYSSESLLVCWPKKIK